jgi:poly(3-hydroxybutyrate) depolymerase
MRKHNKGMYHLYEMQRKSIKAYFNMLAFGYKQQAGMLEAFGVVPLVYNDMAKRFSASAEMLERMAKDYHKPAFDLNQTVIAGKNVSVTQEVIAKKDFGSLLHFKRDTAHNDPKVLIVAPMSGHYATMLKSMVETLLPHHDVYVVDWENARDVPLSKGDFGFDDYVRYVQDFIKETGSQTHLIAISQSTVPVLAATALIAEDSTRDQPLSMTLMCGPIDPNASETAITHFVKDKSIAWFSDNQITCVPDRYAGAGRPVYPGFLQLAGLLSTDPQVHMKAHMDLFNELSGGNYKKANEIKKFYDEYLAVCDLTAKFYLDTIEKVFLKQELAKGTLKVQGKKVDLGKITKTSLFTVEGGKDKITAPGQTIAAHALCKGLSLDQHRHYLHREATHYSLFSGELWQHDILPRLQGHLRASAQSRGITYDPVSQSIVPEKWSAANDNGQKQNSQKAPHRKHGK